MARQNTIYITLSSIPFNVQCVPSEPLIHETNVSGLNDVVDGITRACELSLAFACE